MESIGWSKGALLWLIFAIIAVIHGEIQIVKPTGGKVYTQVGASFLIKAISTDPNAGEMDMCHEVKGTGKCEKLVPATTPNYKKYNENGQIVIEYSPSDIAESVVGLYKITQGAETKTVGVDLVNIAVVNGTVSADFDDPDVTVECRVSGVDVNYMITWTKDGQIVTQAQRPHVAVNGTLTIQDPEPKDVGKYTCEVKPSGSNVNMTANAYVHSPPYVERFSKGKNLVQGDSLEINCEVFGYPLPTISWLKDEEPLKPDNRTTVRPLEGRYGEKLLIKDLTMEDKAEYGCMATNVYNSTTQYITVRVKDKYAALWPFLGICVEVIILCAIIFLYEKRRNKKNAEKEKSSEKATAQNGKGDDVRQRNKNAVKA